MIPSFHAHVYYDEQTRPLAAKLREGLQARFTVQMGRWRDEPVGPHPQAMYQVAFANAEFAAVVQWLMLNHQGLSILIHPNTGDDLADHRDHPLWLGEKLDLRLGMFEAQRKAG